MNQTICISMLTEKQRKMLERRRIRDIKDPKDQKYIDYTLRNYIKKQLNSLKDLLEVLSVLPEDQIKMVLTPQQAIDLFDVLEKFLEIEPPNEVIERGNRGVPPELLMRYRVHFGKALPGVNDGTTIVYVRLPASEEERLYEIRALNFMNYVLPNVFENLKARPPEYSSKEFNRKIIPTLNKIANERGAFCKVEVVGVVGDPTSRFRKSDPLSAAKKKIKSHIPEYEEIQNKTPTAPKEHGST